MGSAWAITGATEPFSFSGHTLFCTSATIAAFIRRAISAGHFGTTDPELALATAGGALLGLLHLRVHSNDHGPDNHPEQLRLTLQNRCVPVSSGPVNCGCVHRIRYNEYS